MKKMTGGKAGRFAAFYAMSGRFIDGLREFSDGGRIEGMGLDEFQKNFSYVGTFSGNTPDEVFGLLQDGGGGLGVECDRETGEVKPETQVAGRMMQELLVAKIGHTSMSKGDVLVNLETGEVLICASCGWDKLVITGMRQAVA